MNDGIPNVTVVLVGDDGQAARESFPAETRFVEAEATAESVNEAVAGCDTKWVMVFSTEDRACPYMLENLLAMAYAADVVYQGIRGINAETGEEERSQPVPPFCGNRILDEDYLPAAAMILRDSFLEVGGYRAEAAPLEAWDLFIRGQQAGWRFKPCAVTCYDMRLVDREPVSKELVDSLRVEQDLLATFYYQASHPCAYLRCILPAKQLPGLAHPDLYAITSDDPDSEVVFPYHQGDAAVLQFAGDKSWALMQEFLQHQGVRTLVEVDDNYLYDPGAKIRGKSNWGRKLGDSIHTYEGHRLIVKRANGVIVTTERLAQSYRKFNEDVFVIPNPVDPVDWEHVKRHDDGIFRIGWFASTSHMTDIPLIREGLAWASRQKEVEVLIMGIAPKWKFPFTQLPWVDDLDMYRLLLGMLDVGVCPIVPDSFSVFRSDVKASEMSMGGSAVICSQQPPYVDRVHEEDCLKASSSADFLQHIRRLVHDREETKQLAAAGKEWVLANRHIERLIPLWAEALQVGSMVAA